ncbi:hypothetical protein IAQ61_010430 [Plenodomus lingam]|nr:hypothetical protein IAQ61_010430 [Plenodomus lingam]
MYVSSMLGDCDANTGGGRTSRASNMSATSRVSDHPQQQQQGQDAGRSDLLSAAAPGVMSMLRTSTEMGNVASLTGSELSGVGSLPRAPPRRGASSRLSTTSSHSNHSGQVSRQHRQRPSQSSGTRRLSAREPMGLQYVADTLSPTVMNIPGSSPLVPRAGNRDSNRSMSMTHMSHPTYRLSSNRSLGSLRHEQIQRSRSPYVYPTRLRRPSYRSGSPALSEVSGNYPRRTLGYGGPSGSAYYSQQYASGHPVQNPGQQRLRMPSDTSSGQQDRMYHLHHRPSRGPSPVYYPGSRPNMPPPLPAGYQHNIAIEQARMLNRSTKGSMSSGSTNLRTDSDPPSSDMALPPTPKDGASGEVMFGPESAQIGVNGVHSIVNGRGYSRTIYYDGSEQFENEQPAALKADPTAFVSRYNTIMEEKGPLESISRTSAPYKNKTSVEFTRTEVPGMAELPASPVPRRITRGQVLQALEPSSTVGDVTSTVPSSDFRSKSASLHSDDLPARTSPLNTSTAEASLHPNNRDGHRHSILSQTGSSVLDSSTLEFAVRYSIPMATGAGFAASSPSVPNSGASASTSREKSSEDGMLELLAGYQHTETKHEGDVMSQKGNMPKKSSTAEHGANRARSSEEQSFKSCTDLPEPLSEPGTPVGSKSRIVESVKSRADRREPSIKDSDARSFSTAKVAVTPDQATLLLPSRVPASNLSTVAVLSSASAFEAPLSSPSPAVLRKPLPSSQSSFIAIANKLRPSSKPSIKQNSLSISVSGSSSTLSATQQPPTVPPRESSSSKEAQRFQATASFLMRQFPSLRTKGWKQDKDTDNSEASPKEVVAQTSTKGKHEPCDESFSSDLPVSEIKTPEKTLSQGNVPLTGKDRPSSLESTCNPPGASGLFPSVTEEQSVASSPFPPYYEPSSVYSPQDASLPLRASSSPAAVSPPENIRRQSQVTTHLVWPGHKSLNMHSASGAEPQVPWSNIQENTTTDLRLSGYGYKYPGPAHHLPDVKEESHEDSSLNTSATNLKNSNFRFPYGVPPLLRASVDGSLMTPQRLSTGSHQPGIVDSALGQTRGLPSMHFSQMNLIEKWNEELGLQRSELLEDVSGDSEKRENDNPRRPVSSSEVREKFRSFVAGLEKKLELTEGISQPTDQVNQVALRGTRSPEQIIAEIESLTIPSVGGLTQRISELLPSLREYYQLGEHGDFPEEEIIIEKAMQKLAEVAPTQKRSSARLRPVPGSPNMIVINDAVFEELTGKDKGGAGTGTDSDKLVEGSCVVARPSSKQQGQDDIHTQTRQVTSLVELEKPSPVRLRPRSYTVGPQAIRPSSDSDLSSRRSLRSVASTPNATNSRPWNTDKNWPWASATVPSLDISLPPPAATRDSPRHGPSHLRNSLSGAVTASSFLSGQTATASPFGSASDNAHARQHRFSAFGHNVDQPHAVGERYPTSALTPPTAIFRDHFTPSDTSDDEDFNPSRKSRLGLRKRFSSARSAKADQNSQATRSKTNLQELASPESHKPTSTSIVEDNAAEAEAFTSHRHTFRDAEGMRGSVFKMSLRQYSTDIKANIEMGKVTYACHLIAFEAVFRRHWFMDDGVPMDEGFIDADCPPCVPFNTFAPGTPVPLGWVPTRNGAYWESGRSQGDRIR